MHTLYTVSLGTQTTPNRVNQTASPSFSCHTSDHPVSHFLLSPSFSHSDNTAPSHTFPLSRTASQCVYSLSHSLSLHLSHSSHHTAPNPYLSLAPFPSGFILSHSLSLHLSHSSHHTAPNLYLSLSHCFPVYLFSFTQPLSASFSQ